jgi:hypothetical protein
MKSWILDFHNVFGENQVFSSPCQMTFVLIVFSFLFLLEVHCTHDFEQYPICRLLLSIHRGLFYRKHCAVSINNFGVGVTGY